MTFIEIFIISLALAMDAFAVSICKGLCSPKLDVKKCSITGLYFGSFQALMPLIGFYAGSVIGEFIKEYDHWVSFFILLLIGINMIKESREEFDESKCDISFSPKTMLPLAIATSIDALTVGLTFSLFDISIFSAIITIGIITFIFSFIGVILGFKFGTKYKKVGEILGGVVLIIIATKILLQGISM